MEKEIKENVFEGCFMYRTGCLRCQTSTYYTETNTNLIIETSENVDILEGVDKNDLIK